LKAFGRAEPLGLSWAFVIFIGAVVIGDFCLRKTVFGRMVYATGGNKEVARIAGINTDWVKLSCYMLTGALAGAGGMLLMANSMSANQRSVWAGNWMSSPPW